MNQHVPEPADPTGPPHEGAGDGRPIHVFGAVRTLGAVAESVAGSMTTSVAETPRRQLRQQVHLYLASVSRWLQAIGHDPKSLRPVLSEEERRRADRFVRATDRERFLVAHWLLRQLLGRYTGTAPEAVRFCLGARGKPWLSTEPGEAPPLHFNLSHAGDLVLIGLADTPLGVDIEAIPDGPMPDEWTSLAAMLFTPDEWAALVEGPETSRRRQLTQRWAHHEALRKATGVGLGAAGPSPGVQYDAVADHGDWRIVDLRLTPPPGTPRVSSDDAPPSYAGAIAIAIDPRQDHVRTWWLEPEPPAPADFPTDQR